MDVYVIYMTCWGLGLIACYWVGFSGYGKQSTCQCPVSHCLDCPDDCDACPVGHVLDCPRGDGQ